MDGHPPNDAGPRGDEPVEKQLTQKHPEPEAILKRGRVWESQEDFLWRRWRVSQETISVLFLFLFLLSFAGSSAWAQSFDASGLAKPAALDSKWRVQAGDDPAYARTDFDDSGWPLFDPNTSIVHVFPKRPSVLWYRLRVKVNPAQSGQALSEWNISRAFEVYVNGERLIGSGKIAPYEPYTSAAHVLGRIPDRMLATGTIVIAIRVHITPSEWERAISGILRNESFHRTMGDAGQGNWLGVIGGQILTWLDHFLLIVLGVVALVLYVAQRSQREYLWIAAMGAVELLELPFR